MPPSASLQRGESCADVVVAGGKTDPIFDATLDVGARRIRRDKQQVRDTGSVEVSGLDRIFGPSHNKDVRSDGHA
jgi:hypothetical protein